MVVEGKPQNKKSEKVVITMNEIKRRLMNGYVELADGTYAKEVNGKLVQVHEDEASAFEPEMFLDVDEMLELAEVTTWTEKSLF